MRDESVPCPQGAIGPAQAPRGRLPQHAGERGKRVGRQAVDPKAEALAYRFAAFEPFGHEDAGQGAVKFDEAGVLGQQAKRVGAHGYGTHAAPGNCVR